MIIIIMVMMAMQYEVNGEVCPFSKSCFYGHKESVPKARVIMDAESNARPVPSRTLADAIADQLRSR